MAIDPARLFNPIRIAVLTISDTRTGADDTSGDLLVERIKAAGHKLAARAIERDDPGVIVSRLSTWIDDGPKRSPNIPNPNRIAAEAVRRLL